MLPNFMLDDYVHGFITSMPDNSTTLIYIGKIGKEESFIYM